MEGNPIERNLSENEAENEVVRLIDESLIKMDTEELENFLEEYKELNFFTKNKLEKAMLETKDGKLFVFLSKLINRLYPRSAIDPIKKLHGVAIDQARQNIDNKKKETRIKDTDVKTPEDVANNIIIDAKQKAVELRKTREERNDNFKMVAGLLKNFTDDKSLKDAIVGLMAFLKIYPDLDKSYVKVLSDLIDNMPKKEAKSNKMDVLKRMKDFLSRKI